MTAQRERVVRSKEWATLAGADLRKVRQALAADLAKLSDQAGECRAEAAFCTASLDRAKPLFVAGVMSREEYDGYVRKKDVADARLAQAESARTACTEREVLDTEAELARRDKALAEDQARLGILEAGSRPEEVDAEKARLERLVEEIAHLERLRGRQAIHSPVAGIVSTPRLREAVGRHVREGDPICVVEGPADLEAEIALTERDIRHVRPGQPIELKVQMLPLETFTGKVDRIAPRTAEDREPAPAAAGTPHRVTVYCRLDQTGELLRPGMTGHARINCGQKPLGTILADRAMRLVRTEFWWW